MKKERIIKKLEAISKSVEVRISALDRFVAEDILDHLEGYDKPEDFFKDLAQGGCKSGMINALIYTTDTHAFFDKYYDEIMALVADEGLNTPVNEFWDLKNDLAWYGYEQTAFNLASELEIEF